MATERLQAIVETLNRINAAEPTVDQVMEMVLDRAGDLTRATGAVVELAEGEDMVYRAASGTASGSIGMRLKLATSLSGRCVREGRVLVCDDTETDPRVDREACRRIGARSMLVAPLEHRDAVVGVLKVFADTPHAFGPEDVDTLQMLAGFIAASLARTVQFETNVAQMQELSRLNEALDSFSAHVAHDLRSPLAIIGMGVETLGRMLGTPEPDVAMVLEMLAANVERSIDLTTDLLRLARASRSPDPTWFDLGEVVADAAQDAPSVRVENRCTGVPMEADRGAVRQALANLLTNAGRYAADSTGAVHATVTCEATSEGWRVVVTDRGPGVADEERERIFDAFVRGGRGSVAEGTGLGLAVVAAVARAHCGAFGCENGDGGGASFWFTITPPRAELTV